MRDRLRQLSEEKSLDGSESPFTEFEEGELVGLALDLPEYFQSIADLLDYKLFTRIEVKYVMSLLLDYHAKHNMIPTRLMLHNQAMKDLVVDDVHWETIRDLVDTPINPRNIPIIKETLHGWARKRSFGQLFEDEAMLAYARGDYDKLEEIVNKANRMVETSARGFWLYEQSEELFQPDRSPHITTGFPQLDRVLNNGGPSPGEVICWLAATGVGKSIMLCNNAIHQSVIGNNVLLVTFELDAVKTAMRCLGALTHVNLKEFVPLKEMDKAMRDLIASRQAKIRDRVRSVRGNGAGQVYIVELPPDECSVNHIYSEIHQLKRSKGWVPQAVVIDYLELMVGRRSSDNENDYTRQKQVANQVRGLARNEKALVFTATQGNRSANDTSQNIDLQKIAESYGKSMSLDYVISLNQTPEEYVNRRIRLWVAKNRNGQKQVSVDCSINYDNMHVAEAQVY